MKSFALVALLFVSVLSFGQADSLVFKNGNHITGKIKSMTRGVLTFETDYSDSDFKIKWGDIKFLHSEQNFNFYLVDGKLLSGKISVDSTFDGIKVVTEDEGTVSVELNKITEVSTFDINIKDRIDASVDFGYSVTKANNLQQWSLRSRVSYNARKWKIYAAANSIRSTQDDAPSVKRTDGYVGVDYFMDHNFFARVKNDFLGNDEQNIKLRSTTAAGLGKFIIRNNKMYWNVLVGTAFNSEQYITEDNDKVSQEGLISTEFNAFSTGDLSFSTSVAVYPSFTESGRIRSDFAMDFKYDLPLNFYVGFGATLNYDNQPVPGGSDTDYILQTSIGWEL